VARLVAVIGDLLFFGSCYLLRPAAIRNVVSQASRAFWGMTQTDLATHHRRLSLTASIDVQAANTTGLGTWVSLEGIGVSAGEGRR